MNKFSLLLVPLMVLSLQAQQTAYSAFDHDYINQITSDASAFGVFNSGAVAEATSQYYIPNFEIPNKGAVLQSISILTASGPSNSPFTIVYNSLKITISTISNGTTVLSNTFANNLPNPVVVLNKTNLFTTHQVDTWTEIPFDVPFTVNNDDSLVIEIRKIVSQNTIVQTLHTSVESPNSYPVTNVRTFGGIGSGASLATTATISTPSPLRLVLKWTVYNRPVLKLTSVVPGLIGNSFKIGSGIDSLVQGIPNTPYINTYSTTFYNIGTLFNPGSGIDGYVYIAPSSIQFIGTLDGSGIASNTLLIPNDPSLIGISAMFQAANYNGVDWVMSNAALITVKS